MYIGRTKKAAKNALWGIIGKMGSLFLSFLLRTVLINSLGAEYLGLNSLFSSILRILSLAELGFGTAVTFSMYKPVAEGDHKMICALLHLYRKIYRIISIFILFAGLILMPFIHLFIAGDIKADINIYILYFINLLNVSLSYACFGYSSSIFIAHQNNDIPMIISLMTEIFKTLAQIILLLTTHNYYLYVIILPIASVATNLLNACAARKYYPQYRCNGEIDKELKKSIYRKTSALLSVKVTTVIYNAADSVVISSFLGLVILAKYNNYYYIMNSVIIILSTIYNALTSSVGNSIVTESRQKIYKDYMNLSFINAWIVGWCTVCLFCLYQPFMHLWAGDELMFEFGIVICFCIYFYVFQLKNVQSTYKDAAGLWQEDMWRSYVSNIFNLIVNLILVQFIGVYGVLISTILALLLVSYPWQTWMIHKKLFHCSMQPFVVRLLIYTAVTLVACFATQCFCTLLTGPELPCFFLKCLLCMIIPNILFFLFSFRTPEFRTALSTVRKIIFKD